MFIYMRQHILELYRELGLSSVSNTIGISNYLMLPLIDAEAAFRDAGLVNVARITNGGRRG